MGRRLVNAWKALGRSVRKGEHGVKVATFIECSGVGRDPASGEEKAVSYRRPWTTTVFHVSQTEHRRKDFLDPTEIKTFLEAAPHCQEAKYENHSGRAAKTIRAVLHRNQHAAYIGVTVPQQVLHDRGSIGSCNDF
jgi:antirestriction protein ArdC